MEPLFYIRITPDFLVFVISGLFSMRFLNKCFTAVQYMTRGIVAYRRGRFGGNCGKEAS
jgi:hypothetical protein